MTNPFLDKNLNIAITKGTNLNHWHQDGKLQFITFRLADSLPQSKIVELKAIKNQFEIEHPKPWDENLKLQFYNLIGPVENSLLDNGLGSCVLVRADCRMIVSEAIRFFNGTRYDIIGYVIMPNHVHLLIHLIDKNRIEKIIQSIKRYTAREINRLLGKTGALWMEDYFDRMIRSEKHMKKCVEYMMKNPEHLREREYELYVNNEIYGD